MKLLGIDFETTGLLGPETRIVEAGLAYYDTDVKKITTMVDFFIYHPEEPAMPEAERVHGLSWAVLKDFGKQACYALEEVANLIAEADFCVAHNGNNFDKPLLEQEMRRLGIPLKAVPWIDTARDVPYPETMTSRRLVHLAAEHGILNPFPHRAVFDVVTMLTVLSHYDIDQIVKNASALTIRVRGVGIGYDQRELPKARRYRWEPAGKFWYKDIKDFELEKEHAEAPFDVTVIPISS